MFCKASRCSACSDSDQNWFTLANAWGRKFAQMRAIDHIDQQAALFQPPGSAQGVRLIFQSDESKLRQMGLCFVADCPARAFDQPLLGLCLGPFTNDNDLCALEPVKQG